MIDRYIPYPFKILISNMEVVFGSLSLLSVDVYIDYVNVYRMDTSVIDCHVYM